MINAKVRQVSETQYGYEFYECIYLNIIRIYHDSDTGYNNITIVYKTLNNDSEILERATFDTNNLQIEFLEIEGF